MALRGLEVHKARRSEFVLVVSRAYQQPTLQNHNQSMLMHLVVIESLALRKGQQDHPVGVVVGAKHPRGVGVNLFGVQLPQLHPLRSYRCQPPL